MLQLGHTGIAEETKQILKDISSRVIDIQDSTNLQQLGHLQAHAPVIADFICKYPKVHSQLSGDVCSIVRYILTKVECTYEDPTNPPSSYGSSQLRRFPTQASLWPVIRGYAKYAADGATTAREVDDCQKAPYGHPSLTSATSQQ